MPRTNSNFEAFVRDVAGPAPLGVLSVKLELKDRENIGRFYTVVRVANIVIINNILNY